MDATAVYDFVWRDRCREMHLTLANALGNDATDESIHFDKKIWRVRDFTARVERCRG